MHIIYFAASINFSPPYLLPWQPYKFFFLISQAMKILSPFFADCMLFTQTLSVKICVKFYHRKFEVFIISWLCGYLLCWWLLTRKLWISRTNLHSINVFVGYFGIWRCLPDDYEKKKELKKCNVNFHDSCYEIHLSFKWSKLWKGIIFIILLKKNLDGTKSWNFGRIPQHLLLTMQNIGSFC